MKENIKRVDYHKKPSQKGKWYVWVEKCDRCGKVYRTDEIMSMQPPNMEEHDYCVNCLRYLLNEHSKGEDKRVIENDT